MGVWALIWLNCLLAACSGSTDGPGIRRDNAGTGAATGGNGGASGSGGASKNPQPLDGGLLPAPGGAGAGGSSSSGASLVISPDDAMLTIDALDPKAIEFKARLKDGTDSAVPVSWRIDNRDIGTIDASNGKLTPSGAAGKVTITARAGSLMATMTVELVVKLKQEGDPDAGGMPEGAGGLGGVGGEGGGTKITDAQLRAALDGTAMEDAELTFLYPYDGTVWPRGLPAPLLQWKHGAHAPLAVKLQIDVGTAYHAELYLGAPMGLTAGQAIDRIPIPQAVWRNGLQSGEQMKVSLTYAASNGSGGYTTYKAKNQLTWTIAPTALKGVVYYNSYGTKLVDNFSGAQGGNGRFGGATLAIARDTFDPALVAGTTTQDDSGCRVCHVVSADGSRLIVQRPNYMSASSYDLRNGNAETMYPTADDMKFGWAALSADGSFALGAAGPPGSGTTNPSSLPTSGLWRTTDGTALTARNLSSFVTQAATPAFSPDMSKLTFNLFQGPGTANITANGRSLVVMDVTRIDDSTYDFTNPKVIYTATGQTDYPGWPFFLPDNSGVVFELELIGGYNGGEHFSTRQQARGELWWTDLDGHAHALDRANGKGYLPTGDKNHGTDTTLQYEPTVAPIVAGGYAWVVFTSRRLYGNVATREPFESDPRGADLNPGNPNGPTTKKLWVSAIDIPPKKDSDPSHPAFYLPAQELYAGNSRGYWALDACKQNDAACSGGDECCGGFCTVDPEFGVGTCTDVPPSTCSKEYDKCNVTADCCQTNAQMLFCIAGRCAQQVLQ